MDTGQFGDYECKPVCGRTISASANSHALSGGRHTQQENEINTLCKPNKVAIYSTQTGMPLKNLRYLRKRIHILKRKPVEHQLSSVEELLHDDIFIQIVKNMTKKAHSFLRTLLKIRKKPKRKQFSLLTIIDALSYFKKSPICYRFLSKYLPLPSVTTIHQLLNKVKITSGINPILFTMLKNKNIFQEFSDRVCSLIFGEMPLTPYMSYDPHIDKLHGLATNKNYSIAKRAIVFMIKGISNDFKFEQPVAYYFTNEFTKMDLILLIRTVVEYVVDAGFIIVSLICNDSALNVSAITQLVNETKAKYLRRGMAWHYDMIRIKRQIIIPLYNTVNLIMGIRNHLLDKDLVYTIDNEDKIIKLKYYQMLLDSNKPYEKKTILQSLTEQHTNPSKLNKTDPTLALQLFSHNVAASTHYLVKWGKLPQECNNLVDLTLLLDDLFDTLNGDTTETVPDGKMYKGPVTIKAPHYKLWGKAKTVLKTVKFIKNIRDGDKIRHAEITVQPITNLIKTIEGMEAVCKRLYYKFGHKIVLTINLSYNPVAKLFENIKNNGLRRYNAPNTLEFERGFKASMINTRVCTDLWLHEDDDEDYVEYFQTFNFFFSKKNTFPSVDEESDISFDNGIIIPHTENVSGKNGITVWIIKRYLKKVANNCITCRKTLLKKKRAKTNSCNKYKYKILKNYPNKYVKRMFNNIQNQATMLLRGAVPKTKLKHKIKEIVEPSMNTPVYCKNHNNIFKKYFINIALRIIIHRWCTSINQILVGKNIYIGESVMKIAASNLFRKYRIRKYF